MHTGPRGIPAEKAALHFARALAERRYAAAYEMLSRELRSRLSADAMQQAFESIIPADWGPVHPIQIATSMVDWPGKQANDAAWIHVSLGGQAYSEGLTLVLAVEGSSIKVRQIEWGRP